MEPNPVAIAWYVEEAQRLLEDQQRRAESLRTRGGQIAGFGAAVLALIGGNTAAILGAAQGFPRIMVGAALLGAAVCLTASVAVAIWGVLKPRPFATFGPEEIGNYASDRFLSEPDLWRVHVRSLRSLEAITRHAEEERRAVARAIAVSLYAFLAGLGFTLISLGTLTLEPIYG